MFALIWTGWLYAGIAARVFRYMQEMRENAEEPTNRTFRIVPLPHLDEEQVKNERLRNEQDCYPCLNIARRTLNR